jgi:hypothetical protein
MEDTDMNWRKATYSNGGADACVEVGTSTDRVAVRDTTNRDGGTLSFTAEAWQTFMGTIRQDLAKDPIGGEHPSTDARPLCVISPQTAPGATQSYRRRSSPRSPTG